VEFGEAVGVSFRDLGLVLRAFTHSSVASSGLSNELLEFLGDAAMGLAVSELLVSTFPAYSRRELLVTTPLFSSCALSLMCHPRNQGSFWSTMRSSLPWQASWEWCR